MTSPTEKHREIAKVIYDALGRGSTRDEEVIARALAKSEREGMKRAEAICYARSKDHHKRSRRYEADGDEASQAVCLSESVEALECASAIRSEAGEG